MESTTSPLVAGADFGTSALKLVLVDVDGRTVAAAQADYPTDRRRDADGTVRHEQDPEDWWKALTRALAETGLSRRIVALGLTGQMQDLVLLSGIRPVRPAILYSDQRAAAQQHRLLDRLPSWHRRAGSRQDATSVAATLRWLADHEPENLSAADGLVFGPAGCIARRLGAEGACDLTTASTTGLLDLAARDWWAPVADEAGIGVSRLPRLVDEPAAEGPVVRVRAAEAAELGLPVGTPVVLGLGDAAATTDGLVGSVPGEAYASLGTSGWIAAVTPGPPDDGADRSAVHQLAMGREHLLRIAAVQSAGGSAEWSRRHLLDEVDHAAVEERAAERIDRLSERPLCLPGLGGERYPVRNAEARGTFIGVTEATEAIDLHLAVLTGVAYALAQGIEELGLEQQTLPVVGGGAESRVWRRLLADATGRTVVHRAETDDAAARHAARAAAAGGGLGHRVPPHFSEAGHDDAAVSVVEPSSLAAEHARLREIHRELHTTLAPTFGRLAGT
ncbi:FGGY family carbohydrate kinase [Nesterenkonia sp. F]|uniref:FGGY family carbohydrate kinase n=1 Tax=Nesterenkonia sp. F TaxID=795955 RepID=UPI000255CFEB|nr:FGGY family carbohydrate kinase [Nesterenkonia sp. F]